MLAALLVITPALVRDGSVLLPTMRVGATRAQPLMAFGVEGHRQALAGAVVAAGLAMGSPAIAMPPAVLTPPAMSVSVEGFNVNDDELRPEQKKFLEERASKPQVTQYEKQVEGTFKKKEVTEGGKFKYSSVVVGLLVLSVVAPMAQFFYYVKEEDE
mmetsp:Transcript_19438/g.50150  ORF Transcript_19438/g.50150 Transcript_19438/m.50150 type:complete len:157 (+) Transcript_19438:190-660(+)